jgi:Iron-containing redox enzyme
MNLLEELLRTLDKMVNDQFESVEFKNFLAVPLTLERGRFYVIQNALYTSNRRDCWGYVQGGSPLDVKRVIWEHESDELINDPRAGMDHYALTVKQGEVIGLKPMHNHWLSAYTASHMLERRNNGKIVKGGGMSYRVGKKFENELGINLKRMISLDVHVVADTDHSENISEMFERYVKTEEDCDLVLKGAQESMAIDRAYRGAVGYYMAQIN